MGLSWFGRWLAWIGFVCVVLLCALVMLELLHTPASAHVTPAQVVLTTPESSECVAWDNVAVEAGQMSRRQLDELQRQVCPNRPLSDPGHGRSRGSGALPQRYLAQVVDPSPSGHVCVVTRWVSDANHGSIG